MTTRLITGPAALAVDLAAARIAARTTGAALDGEIELKIRQITEIAEHYMGRSVITQTWKCTLDSFPTNGAGGDGSIRLYNPPLQSVTHVKYYDADNVQQTLDPADYVVDAESDEPCIVPAPNVSWPDTYERINAVEVEFVCGFGATEASVPFAIKGYILAKVHEHFTGAARSEYLERGLDRHKIWSLG